ncbi:MAG TPA: DUF2125 domain-containing protein [Rhizomicrobium sp.]|nr:DUF2125 domain-containing protein [Rhizomicrobium sp.]
MNYSHRFFLYGPVGLFAILMLAVMTYGWVRSNAVSHRLDAINGHEIAPGIKISFDKKTMSGFPFRVDTELDGLRVEIATSHGPTVWTAEHFASHELTYGRTQFVLEAAGRQHIEWHDDRGGLHHYDFLPGSLHASVIAEHGTLARFDLELLDADSPDIAAAQVQLHLRKDPKFDGTDVFVSADGVHIAPDLKPAFGPDVKTLRIDAMVSPGSSFDRLLSGHADWRVAVEDWRARHGGLMVKAIRMDWGKLNISGKGALAVDDAHRPMGTLRLSVGNWLPLLQEAEQEGWVKAENDGLAAGFLSFASGAQADKSQLDTTLGFQNGIVFVGSVPADLLSPLY